MYSFHSRLTVLVDKCRQIVQCILPRTLSMNSSEEHFGSGDINLFLPNSGQELPEDEDAVLPIPEHVSLLVGCMHI